MMEGLPKRIKKDYEESTYGKRSRKKAEIAQDIEESIFNRISKLPIKEMIQELKKIPLEHREAIHRKLPLKTLGRVLSEWYEK